MTRRRTRAGASTKARRRAPRPDRASSCDGKRRLDRTQALDTAAWFHRHYLANVRAYRCRFCGHWHTGNVRP